MKVRKVAMVRVFFMSFSFSTLLEAHLSRFPVHLSRFVNLRLSRQTPR
jgi:hypothetical protein